MWDKESKSNLSTIMHGSIRAIKPEEMKRYGVSEQSFASAKQSLLPSSFDPEKNIDVLPVVFNLAVVNSFNANDDGIKTAVAIDIVKQFINKPINLEHMKDKIVGHIINASFSDKQPEFEYNEIEAYKDRKDPFYITAAGLVYRHIFPSLAEMIIEASNPESEKYQEMSISWEIGFRNYTIAIGEGSMHESKEIEEDDESHADLKGCLKAYGGTGYSNMGRVRRIIQSPAFPLGVGITESPAADVSGIYILLDDEEEEDEEEENEEDEKENDNSFSQDSEKYVKANKSSFSMNEEQFQQLMAALQESKASSEMATQIKRIFDEQNEWKSKAEASKQELENTLAQFNSLQSELEKTSKELSSIKEEIEAKNAAELFNARVKDVLEKYELTEAQEKIVIDEVKSLDSSEASFEAYKAKVAVIFAGQNKEALASIAEAKKAEIEKAAKELLESKASKQTDELETEETEASSITNNNAGDSNKETLLEKIRKTGLQFKTA